MCVGNFQVIPAQLAEDAKKAAWGTRIGSGLTGEDHWLSRSSMRFQMMKSMVDFVEKNNPPDLPAH